MIHHTMNKVTTGVIKVDNKDGSFTISLGSGETKGTLDVRPRKSDPYDNYKVGDAVLIGYLLDNDQMPYLHSAADDYGQTW